MRVKRELLFQAGHFNGKCSDGRREVAAAKWQQRVVLDPLHEDLLAIFIDHLIEDR